MRYVTCMGELYRMTARGYRKMLQDIADLRKSYADPSEYGGKLLGRVENVTDLSNVAAGMMLDDLDRETK